MNGLTILIAIVLGGIAARALFRTPRRDDTIEPTRGQREADYRRRVDAAIGEDSDLHQARVARGIAAKTRMLATLRRIEAQRAEIPACLSLVPVAPPRVRYTGRRRRHLRAVA